MSKPACLAASSANEWGDSEASAHEILFECGIAPCRACRVHPSGPASARRGRSEDRLTNTTRISAETWRGETHPGSDSTRCDLSKVRPTQERLTAAPRRGRQGGTCTPSLARCVSPSRAPAAETRPPSAGASSPPRARPASAPPPTPRISASPLTPSGSRGAAARLRRTAGGAPYKRKCYTHSLPP